VKKLLPVFSHEPEFPQEAAIAQTRTPTHGSVLSGGVPVVAGDFPPVEGGQDGAEPAVNWGQGRWFHALFSTEGHSTKPQRTLILDEEEATVKSRPFLSVQVSG